MGVRGLQVGRVGRTERGCLTLVIMPRVERVMRRIEGISVVFLAVDITSGYVIGTTVCYIVC